MDKQLLVNKCKLILRRAGIDNDNEVYYIISGICGISRADMITLDNFTHRQTRAIMHAIRRRARGVSMQLVIGYTDFNGVRLLENRATLTPRPETEYMASIISRGKPCKVLDICAGSGAIGLSLASKGFDVTLSDISAKAIRQIRKNATLNNLDVHVVRSNMFDKVHGTYDIIVCNPPYIPSDECDTLDAVVRDNDPLIALDGGKDGLDYYRIIADQAHKYLSDFGTLYLEIGIGQEKSVQNLLEKHYKNITIIKDMNDINRIIKADKIC